MTGLLDQIRLDVTAATEKDITDGFYDDAIGNGILDIVRGLPDDGINATGFVAKMAAELVSSSQPQLKLREAISQARIGFREFLRDSRTRFGAAGWDWSGRGARDIAREYIIAYWEPQS